jgi:hypothetical protein
MIADSGVRSNKGDRPLTTEKDGKRIFARWQRNKGAKMTA